MLTCAAIREQLAAYHLKELDAQAAAGIRTHLDACPDCRAALQEVAATLTLLRDALSASAPATRGLSADRKRLIAASAAVPRAPAVRPAWIAWLSTSHPRLAYAAGATLILGLLWMLVPSARQQQVVPAVEPRTAPLPVGRSVVESPVVEVAADAGTPGAEAPASAPAEAPASVPADGPADTPVKAPGKAMDDGNIWPRDSAVAAGTRGGYGGAGDGVREPSVAAAVETRRLDAPPDMTAMLPTATEPPAVAAPPAAATPSPVRASRQPAKEVASDAWEGGPREEVPIVEKGRERKLAKGAVDRIREDELTLADESVAGRDATELRRKTEAPGANAASVARGGGVGGVAGPRPATESEQEGSGSFAQALRCLERGSLPPPESVSIEEFVAFVALDGSEPSGAAITVETELAPSPFGQGLHLLAIRLRGRPPGAATMPPAAVASAHDAPQGGVADGGVELDFNPAVVSRYRRLANAAREQAADRARSDTLATRAAGAGRTVIALYEVNLSGAPSDAVVATVRVRRRRADDAPLETAITQVRAGEARAAFAEASVDLRLAAAAAEVAEQLRGSPYAAGGKLADVAEVVRPLAMSRPAHPRARELLTLVEQARAVMSRDAGD